MSVSVSTLANGIRLVTHAMPHLETVSLGVWVGVGARYESAGEHGISHLLEHMAFKGTGKRNARDIAEEIESVGGDLNAATSLENTAYYARVLKDDVVLALDILSDILQNPKFDEGELVREKDVILQEIAASQDSPEDIGYDLLQDAAYPGQALGRPILGTEQSVTAFRPDNLSAYLDAHYQPGSMVLAAAGAVDHDALAQAAERAFAGGKDVANGKPAAALYAGGLRVASRPFEQTHFLLGYEGVSYLDENFYAAQILSSMLGGGMSSRLFQEARERRGLCYSIYAFSWGLEDTGLFGVHAATGEDQLASLLDVTDRELARIAADVPEDDELDRAKAQLKAGLMISLESSSARAEQLARQLLAFGRPLAIDELTAKVEAVTGEAVRSVAERLFAASPASATLVGVGAGSGAGDLLAQHYPGAAAQAAE